MINEGERRTVCEKFNQTLSRSLSLRLKNVTFGNNYGVVSGAAGSFLPDNIQHVHTQVGLISSPVVAWLPSEKRNQTKATLRGWVLNSFVDISSSLHPLLGFSEGWIVGYWISSSASVLHMLWLR